MSKGFIDTIPEMDSKASNSEKLSFIKTKNKCVIKNIRIRSSFEKNISIR